MPSPFGCGDLGKSAFDFVDFLHKSGQQWWQMLPVGPIGAGNSPYSSSSTFAGSDLFISFEKWLEEGLIRKKDVALLKTSIKKINYKKLIRKRTEVFQLAFKNFRSVPEFDEFVLKNTSWLEPFACFSVLKEKFRNNDWSKWEAHQSPDQKLFDSVRKENLSLWTYFEFLQFYFAKHWRELMDYAHERNVGLIGDIPIFVPFESADVWSNSEQFQLTAKNQPKVVAGCPPDYFNAAGQVWGNALYDWDRMKSDNFRWWRARLTRQLELFDLIRIDHFIGLHHQWAIPYGKKANAGNWEPTRGSELLALELQTRGHLPYIAEDLGTVCKEVEELRQKFRLPGMKVLQFAFAKNEQAAGFMPHTYDRNQVAYTGTHDNEPTSAWYQSALKDRKKYDQKKIEAYFPSDKQIAFSMVQETMKSPANLCITPMQDLLGLGGSARMNVPGTPKGNWRWRLKPEQVNAKLAKKLAALTQATDRLN